MAKYHKDGTLPENGEIFVFGSNLAGRHGAGAAKVALNMFGAMYGIGYGWTNRSYAIPTKGCRIETMSLESILPYVESFVDVANKNPNTEFWMTSIGCGLAGYEPKDIVPLFPEFPGNVSFPDTWKNEIEEKESKWTNKN